MFDIKELIETGINDGKDSKKMISQLADFIDSDKTKIEIYESIYSDIYGHTLCDKFCCNLVDKMHNEDGKGKRWSIDQTNDIARKLGISFSKDDYTQYEFWTAMHMMYYDYGITLSESGITDPMVYGKLADDYLDDIDAPKGKLVNHFFFVEKNKDIM